MRLPARVEETGFDTINGYWQLPVPATGWQGGIGMPYTSCRLSTNEVSKIVEMEEPAKGDKKAIIVSALSELHISCNSWINVLLLCSVTVAHKKANVRWEPRRFKGG